jgi:exodeoxyribonuclease VII small subunit
MAEKKKPTYEQARDELTKIVAKLEAGGASLEDSIALWERGEELARICNEWLDSAKARLEKSENSKKTKSK